MSSEIVRNDGPGGRTYTVPGGKKYPSVTAYLGAIAKPALVKWAANQEREMVSAAAAKLHASLTSVISEPSFAMALRERLSSKQAQQIQKETAAAIGTIVHERIEWELRKELGLYTKEEPFLPEQLVREDGSVVVHPAAVAWEAFKKWRDDVKLKPVAIEQRVYSHRWEFAGTYDFKGLVRDQLAIVDWKSGKALYDEHDVQIAAYREAEVEMGASAPPLHGVLLRLPKTPADPGFETKDVEWDRQEELFVVFRAARHLFKWQQANRAAWLASRG
jgi:hypothetical protein